MKNLSKSALSVAIVSALAATSAQAEQFMDDSSLNIHLRNFYMNKDVQKGTAKSDKDKSWVQAVRADFSSGYFANIIGIDLSSYYTLKATESRGTSTANDLLQKDSKNKGHSFGKNFGAVKVNLMDKGVAKYGRMVLDTPLLNESDSRSLPSTTEAFYADYTMEGFTFYGAVAKKGNSRTQSGYEDYQAAHSLTDDGEVTFKKEAVKTFGISYEGHGLNLGAAYGKQNNAASALYTDASYSFDLNSMSSVMLGAQYGKVHVIGNSEDIFINKAGGEKSSLSWFGLMAGMNFGKFSTSVSMTDIGDAKGGIPDAGVPWQGGEDSTEFNGYNSVQINDFYNENETSYKVKVGYDFSDMLDGLSASALYVTGKINNSGSDEDVNTSEYNVRIDYAVPQMDGLKFTLRHAKYDANATGKTNDETKKDTRVLITYDFAVF
ncbi:OprD family outer membrane porin [Sansalvadorimonas verongulae]|uniref:OprD family outer membrane porin n=1 Tax=Sansalvadorimonas verongulae TaxID=2172824 RepID=UPI0018AD1091|nr:OprD family outer membrane porin [Sansalvadorimonas verongulae]